MSWFKVNVHKSLGLGSGLADVTLGNIGSVVLCYILGNTNHY